MRPRVEPDGGGDPSPRRAILRAVARGMQVLAGAMLAAAWAMSEGLFGDSMTGAMLVLAGAGALLMDAGARLHGHALRRFTSGPDP
jgi:hypothetical protein